MPKKPSKPHDEFFKATFSRVKVAREYLQKMLSPALLEVLDLKKLKRVNGSYVSPTLREFFTDVVYECPLKENELKICISILFEHKSSPEKYPHFQLLRYMLDAWEEQIKQKIPLTPFVPTIIYHGEENWINSLYRSVNYQKKRRRRNKQGIVITGKYYLGKKEQLCYSKSIPITPKAARSARS